MPLAPLDTLPESLFITSVCSMSDNKHRRAGKLQAMEKLRGSIAQGSEKTAEPVELKLKCSSKLVYFTGGAVSRQMMLDRCVSKVAD